MLCHIKRLNKQEQCIPWYSCRLVNSRLGLASGAAEYFQVTEQEERGPRPLGRRAGRGGREEGKEVVVGEGEWEEKCGKREWRERRGGGGSLVEEGERRRRKQWGSRRGGREQRERADLLPRHWLRVTMEGGSIYFLNLFDIYLQGNYNVGTALGSRATETQRQP